MPAPGQFIPRKSSAHRIACISLYRALLKQCLHIPIPDDIPSRGKENPIKHFVQKQFRKNVWHTSSKMIVAALETGYAARSLFHHAASSPRDAPNPSLLQIHTLLHTLSKDYLASQQASPAKVLSPSKINIRGPYPDAPKTLDIRPLSKEKLTGRRQVPKLVIVHSAFPFMRFKRPQSPFLSQVLNHKMKKKVRCFKLLEEMEEDVMMGEWEDDWAAEIPRAVRDRDSVSWLRAAKEGREETWDVIHEDGKKALVLGEKMVEIIEKEKVLFEEERRERKVEKNRERWVRKLGEDTVKPSTFEKKTSARKPKMDKSTDKPLVSASSLSARRGQGEKDIPSQFVAPLSIRRGGPSSSRRTQDMKSSF